MNHSGAASHMMGHMLLKEPFYVWFEVIQQQIERRKRDGIVSGNEKIYRENLENMARRQKEIDDERQGKK